MPNRHLAYHKSCRRRQLQGEAVADLWNSMTRLGKIVLGEEFVTALD